MQHQHSKRTAMQFSLLPPFRKGGWGDFGAAASGKSPLARLCQRGAREPMHSKLHDPAPSISPLHPCKGVSMIPTRWDIAVWERSMATPEGFWYHTRVQFDHTDAQGRVFSAHYF